MHIKKQSILLAMAVFMFFSSAFAGTYSGGTGEPNDPYLIATAEDMNEIGANPDDWDAHFLLVADINLADYTGTKFNIIGYYDPYNPLNNNPFTGVFDGNGYTISNLTYTTTTYNDVFGLFIYVNGSNAEIKDLILIDPNIEAFSSQHSGCLAGLLENGMINDCGIEGGSVSGVGVGGLAGYSVKGTISNCYATGRVWGETGPSGGLVAYNFNGAISNCYATGDVFGGIGYNGGLVGSNNNGTISNCYATGSVSGGDSIIGGLVGINGGVISDCYATGNISGYGFLGGLAGGNVGTISNCYAMGDVPGDCYIGGLVGDNSEGTISNCYASGNVSGFLQIGGLVGRSYEGTISNCYATGVVLGEGEFDDIGGLVGWDYEGTITASFWDIESTSQPASAGGEGKTTAEMQMVTTFTSVGWDFVDVWDMGQIYPFLRRHLCGDLNFDGVEDFADFAIFADHWLQGPE